MIRAASGRPSPFLEVTPFVIARNRRVLTRFSIGRPDGVTWEDLTGYLASATVSLGDVTSLGTGTAGIDERVRTAQFELIQERADGLTYSVPHSVWDEGLERDETAIVGDEDTVVGDETDHAGKLIDLLFGLEPETFTSDSLSPRDRASLWNSFGGGYAPLIWPRREVYLEVTILPLGEETGGTTTEWYPLFHGQIDDWKVEGNRITIACRDMAARLQDLYLLEPAEYGSEQGVPLETVIQQMLDDHLGPGVVQLYCPVSPGFMVTSYVAEYVTLFEALQTLASQTVGWYLGYRWNEGTGRFELTLMEPPRGKDASTADYALTAREDIYVNDLGGSIADVRNLVKLTYRDSATGERRSVTVSDQASIDEYGLLPMGIEEADTSPIDTEAEALALANAALSDLKDQHATTQLELPLLPWLDLMDGVTIKDPRTSSTVDFYAVESVEHRLDWSDPERAVFRTSAVCSGKVAGAHVKWLAMQTRPGARGEPTRPPTTQRHQAAPEAVSLALILRGFAAACRPVSDPYFEEYELHVSTSPNFKPTGWDGSAWVGKPNDPAAWDGQVNTLAATGRTLPVVWQGGQPGATYHAVMVARNLGDVRSAPSAEVTRTAGALTGAEVAVAFEVQDDDGNTLFRVDKPTGDAYFKGSVEAGAFILPVRATPF